MLLLAAAWASAQTVVRLQLSVAEVEAAAFALRGVELRHHLGSAELAVAELRLGEQRWHGLRLRCRSERLSFAGVQCADGMLELGKGQALAVKFALDLARPRGGFAFRLEFADGARIELKQEEAQPLLAALGGLDLARLPKLPGVLPAGLDDTLARLAAYSPSGELEAKLRWQAQQNPERGEDLQAEIKVANFAFSSTDGLHAAEGVELSFSFRATGGQGGLDWELDTRWLAGEAYFHPLYLQAGLALHARGRADPDWIQVDFADLAVDGVDQLAATARIARERMAVEELAFSLAGGDLAVLGPRWLAPVLAPQLGDRLHFSGHVGAGVQVRGGRLSRLDLAFAEAQASLAAPASEAGSSAAAWTLGPLSGHLPWSAQGPSQARVEVLDARWGALALGDFELALVLDGREAAFESIRVPVLDGAVVVDGLTLGIGAEGQWQGSGSVMVEPLSMSLLSAALGWPGMAGTLSAALPGMHIEPGEISFDGTLAVSVFDGLIKASDLRVSEPFGLASQLHARVEARHVDLGLLTDTFSFGSISGHIDVDVAGLELLRWSPVGFDLRVASSRPLAGGRISQRAVENISALGGSGALAAVQRGLLRIFDSFGYRELGLSAVLADGVCVIEGIDGIRLADGGFPLVRGGGIPALDVIGYNPRVDWQELVDRVERVLGDQVVAEVH